MIVGVRITDRTLHIASWELFGMFVVAMGTLLVVFTVIVARVERLTTREVAVRTLRDSRNDLRPA
jgi:hypothetical protein